MNLQNIFYGVFLALLLAGCAGLPQPGQALTANGDIVISGLEVAPATPLPALMQRRSDVIYNALVGDIAVQRGNYAIAERHYANAARIDHNSDLAEMATRAALAARDYKVAEKRVAYWLKLKPKDTEALQITVLLAVQRNDMNSVMVYLQRLVKVKKAAKKNGYLAAIQMLEHIDDPKVRLALGQKLTARQRHDPQAMFALAVLEAGVRNFTKAEALVRSVLRHRPNLTEAQMLLIQVLKSRRDFKGARTTLEQFVAAAPKNRKLRNAYARMLLEQNELVKAQQQFQRLYQTDAKDGDSLFALGMLALQLDQRGEGRRYLEQLYALGSHQDDAALYLGQIFEEEAQPEDALRWYAKVEGSNRFDAQVRAARIYAKQGSIPRAQEILQQIRGQLNRNVTQMDLVEAEILRDARQYTAALRVLTRALKKAPHNQDLLYARAITAAHVGQIEILEQDLKQIIAKDPNHVEALNALGYTLAAETNRYEEALSYIQRAFAIKPNNPAILDSMGWIQYRMGHPQKAVQYLKRALILLQDPEIAAHLGEVLWQIGDQDQARRVWRDALNKAPESEYLLKMQELYGVRF